MTAKTNSRLATWGLRLGTAWLLVLVAFGAGILVMERQLWPYPLVREVFDYVTVDPEQEVALKDKIRNDFGGIPARHIADRKQPFTPVPGAKPLEGLPLGDRLPPRMFLSPDAPRGFRLLYGTFDFKDSLHGAIVLDADGQLVHVWHLGQEDVPWPHEPDRSVSPHGFDITPDGDIVVGFDGATSIASYNWCGEQRWRIRGGFHHSADIGDDGALWSWGNVDSDNKWGLFLVKIDMATGEVLDHFHIRDLIEANPDVDILGIRQFDNAKGSTWLRDRWHANDIDPLPAALAGHYPLFEAGDLLTSFRSLDLVAVFDPDTRKVKWWRQGLTRRQHDPDWNAAGTITVFNNNMHRGLSNIIEIDPVSFAHHKALPGEPYDFYTWQRGKHQATPGGGFLVTSTQQGRVFETNADGEIVFEFVNDYREDGKRLVLSEAFFLPEDFFVDDLPDCAGMAGG